MYGVFENYEIMNMHLERTTTTQYTILLGDSKTNFRYSDMNLTQTRPKHLTQTRKEYGRGKKIFIINYDERESCLVLIRFGNTSIRLV